MSYTPKYGGNLPDEPGDDHLADGQAVPAADDQAGTAGGTAVEAPDKSVWSRGRIALVALLVLALGLGAYFLTRPNGQRTDVGPVVVATSTEATSASPAQSVVVTSATPTPTPTVASTTKPVPAPVSSAPTSAAAATGECAPMGEGFVPVRYELTNPEADERILSLGEDSTGAIAAPPKNQPRTASWWNNGPKPGSTKGKVVVSIHTYRNGGALGNEMYKGGSSQLKPGDLIKLVGKDGRVACYEFVESKKIHVNDYDPNSDMMVDFEGDPMVAVIICWDFEKKTEFWASRVFFYFKPYTGKA